MYLGKNGVPMCTDVIIKIKLILYINMYLLFSDVRTHFCFIFVTLFIAILFGSIATMQIIGHWASHISNFLLKIPIATRYSSLSVFLPAVESLLM